METPGLLQPSGSSREAIDKQQTNKPRACRDTAFQVTFLDSETGLKSTSHSYQLTHYFSQRMLILLFAFKFLLSVEGFPMSTGPETRPTIAHFVLWGILPRIDSSSSSPERSLYEIIRSCLITITICVYRAIHQNVPDPAASSWKRIGIKMSIAVLTLFAPELVLWWAIRQWFGAREIANLVNEINPDLKWSWTHGQFAQMGGFGIAIDGAKRIVRPDTLIDYLNRGQLDITEVKQTTKKEINDHSKGDLLSKTVLAFRTSGFAFECVARLHQKLPITELEVATLAFATLNIFTYLFWWCKPLDVLCPIYFRVDSKAGEAPHSPTSPASEYEILDPEESLALEPEISAPLHPSLQTSTMEWIIQRFGPLAGTIDHWVPHALQLLVATLLTIILALFLGSVILASLSMLLAVLITSPAVILAMALPLLFTSALMELYSDNDDGWHDRSSHAPTFYSMETAGKAHQLIWPFSCFLGMVFGAVHFISWNSTFHNHIESLLWKISCIIVVAVPFCVFFFKFLGLTSTQPGNQEIELILEVARQFMGLCPFLYIFARICIVIIAFLTLSHLPPGAFATVSWTTYIPHF